MVATKIASLTLLASLALLAQRALAQDYVSPTDERVRVTLGAMYMTSATTLRADSSAGATGTVIRGEDQFGLEKSDWEPKIQAVVRAAGRHRFSFDYFTLDRTGNSIVGATPIVFRNVVFVPDDPLQTSVSLRTLGINYEYSFWRSETVEIAATIGVHATDISSSARVQTQTRHVIQTEDQAGPVPTVGIDATWVISKRFYVDGRAQYLTANVGSVDGSLGLYELEGLYRFRPNVSFGIGYSLVRARLSSANTSQPGLFDFNTKGPDMFVRVAF